MPGKENMALVLLTQVGKWNENSQDTTKEGIPFVSYLNCFLTASNFTVV